MAKYIFGPEDDGTGSRTYMDIDTGDIIVVNDGSGTIRKL